MKRRSFVAALAASSVTPTLLSARSALAAADPTIITLSGAGPQGRWFKEASLFGKVLSQKMPGLTVNGVIGKGVSVGNIKRIAAGKIEGGRFYLFDLENAYANKHQFKKGDYKNVVVWMKLGTHLFRVVALKGIDTFSDLKGRTVAVGVKGSGDDLLASRILAGYGVGPENTKFQYVGRKDGQAALANGQIDAIAYAYARNNKGHLGPIFAARTIGEDVTSSSRIQARPRNFWPLTRPFSSINSANPISADRSLRGSRSIRVWPSVATCRRISSTG